jgi:hypothetical protein
VAVLKVNSSWRTTPNQRRMLSWDKLYITNTRKELNHGQSSQGNDRSG